MKIAADELKTDKRRWFPTERVIKLQNFLPQEFKESKHYISVEGNCCFVEESSNTYLFLFRKSCFCKLLGDQGIFWESIAVQLLYFYMLRSWLLLVRGYWNGHGPLDLAKYSHYFVLKPAPFLFLFLCYQFSVILSSSSTQTLAHTGMLRYLRGVLGPLVTYSFLCETWCMPPKYKISKI